MTRYIQHFASCGQDIQQEFVLTLDMRSTINRPVNMILMHVSYVTSSPLDIIQWHFDSTVNPNA